MTFADFNFYLFQQGQPEPIGMGYFYVLSFGLPVLTVLQKITFAEEGNFPLCGRQPLKNLTCPHCHSEGEEDMDTDTDTVPLLSTNELCKVGE